MLKHLSHEILDEKNTTTGESGSGVTAVDKQRNLFDLGGNRQSLEQCRNVQLSCLELLRVPSLSLLPRMRVQRRLHVNQFPHSWVKSDNVEFAVPTAIRSLSHLDIPSYEKALEFVELSDQSLEVVARHGEILACCQEEESLGSAI